MKAIDVIISAQTTLFDEAGQYWPQPELVRYLDEARLRLASLRPDLYEQAADVTLAAGSVQALPAEWSGLLRALHNVSHPDRYAITITSDALLARIRPRWRSMTPRDEIEHVVYSETDPRRFEVYPPARAGVVVRLAGVKPPAPLGADLSGVLEPERDRAVVLIDYVLARAFAKEGDGNVAALQRARDHMTYFERAVQADSGVKASSSPNQTAPGKAPAGGVAQ